MFILIPNSPSLNQFRRSIGRAHGHWPLFVAHLTHAKSSAQSRPCSPGRFDGPSGPAGGRRRISGHRPGHPIRRASYRCFSTPLSTKSFAMRLSINRWSRKLHRWGAIICLVPTSLVFATGVLLQLKKQVTWVQPATVAGAEAEPELTLNDILAIARSVPDAEVESWEDIDRLDVRPGKHMLKVRCQNRWELQLDWHSGAILSSEYRRSDLIESLHDGSWFSDWTKLYLFLPNGMILCGLWLTGLYLWYLPIGARRKKKKKVPLRPTSADQSGHSDDRA